MILFKPKFWEKKYNLFSILLFPFSILILVFIWFKKITTSKIEFGIPIICIGNIYVGGTGKTPLSILIENELKKKGRNPVIIKKYYQNHKDEHEMIKQKTDNLILNKSRIEALRLAQKKSYNVAIMDDGLQDYSIKKNINIICFNSRQLKGNGLVFPAGPLRESMHVLREANIVIINGDKKKEFENEINNINNNLNVYYTRYLPQNIDEFKSKKLLAFAGIGNPNNFFNLLSDHKLNIKQSIAFPDHYDFTKSELQKIVDQSLRKGLEIITTEKDYHRVKSFGFANINYLKIKLEIVEKNKLINQILNHL